MLIRLNRTMLICSLIFVLIAMSGISYGDDYCARDHQRAYYKYGYTKAIIEHKEDWTGQTSKKAAYNFSLKYAEDDLAKSKHILGKTSTGSDYDLYKIECECIEGAIRLIKKTSYSDMWKMMLEKS